MGLPVGQAARLTSAGDTTLSNYGLYRIAGGRLVFDTSLSTKGI